MFEPTTLSVYTAATPVFLAIVADPGEAGFSLFCVGLGN
jgi:hypothetical protein